MTDADSDHSIEESDDETIQGIFSQKYINFNKIYL